MDKETGNALRELLQTMGEALGHLHNHENEELRQMVGECRQQAAGILESALPRPLEQQVHASALSDEDWLRTACLVLAEEEEPFQPKNAFDREFWSLLDYLWSHSEEELLGTMKGNLQKVKKASREGYISFVRYFARFPFWGTINPDKGDYDTLEKRAVVLKRHSYDFLWLYQRMEDYLSRRTLCAVLKNWALLDMVDLQKVKSIFPDYWEPDIFPSNEGDILVDVGAYIGDSIAQYINMYGTGYKKIYAYEISPGSYAQLCENIRKNKLHDILPVRKGLGASRGEMFIEDNRTDASANQLQSQGSAQARVEVVPLDEDIEGATFIKMDIEGAEQGALLGCERIIRSQHPNLAVCTYHGYEDIWKIPLMIDSMYPEYRFYLRHYGGNLIPTEFVLLCKAEG